MSIASRWAVAALCALVPLSASAHKAFLLPSTTVLSDGGEAWVTFDAAASNDLFYFNHRGMPVEQVVVTTPDGSQATAENVHAGKFRGSFDLHLVKPGTYRVAIPTDGLSATWVDAKGEKKRARGNAQALAKQIPEGAKDVEVTQFQNRIETFVTLGKPDTAALKPAGRGLELVPVTHPNDLFAGEPATFRFVLDGAPAKGLEVVVLAGGTRYRNAQEEMPFVTDANGEFTVTWPAPGMYWLNTSFEGGKPTEAQAKSRRAGYSATLEVLPQ